MADLKLAGTLNLMGMLKLTASGGGKVLVGGIEALVEVDPGGARAHSTSAAPPVILPPPPASPIDPGTKVWVVSSLNKTVTVGGRPLITQGVALSGNGPVWPGMALPSAQNAGGPTVNHLPINVKGDQAIIFPSGGVAPLNNESGQ